jgi:hypothetical protein
MVPSIRKAFNTAFTEERYRSFLDDLNSKHPGAIEFRIAETPMFVPKGFRDMMVECCEDIIDLVMSPGYMEMTERSIPESDRVPNEHGHCHMFAFDFGICENGNGELEPKLIEMQGFPTLFGFEAYYPDVLNRHFDIPANYSHYFGGLDIGSYIEEMRGLLLGEHAPEHVILMEIRPHVQKTRIDFYNTQDYWGIRPVCITELIQEGKKLFYMRDGMKTEVKRIYNRVIFDDLHAQREKLGHFPDITKELEVEWIPHPNWFYRLSKFTLPYLRSPWVPQTYFLNEVGQPPADLENYVLKPLFSFAGQGVVIDIQPGDIEAIKDPEHWILQRKVKYADIIETPDGPAKAEIRMMYIWKDGEPRPKLVTNLARLSKGKMIGVRYNKDKKWVGGSVAYFEK